MSEKPRPTNPKEIPEPDIYGAVYDFVLAFGLPALPPGNIYQGWQNRSALPADSNEYAVISLLRQSRVGTNIETFIPQENGGLIWEIKTLIRAAVQLDFCSSSDLSRRRAQAIETVARSAAGVDFFEAGGLTCLYADDVQDISFTGDAKQFVRRHMTVLHLTYYTGMVADYPGADRVVMERIENVDAHHPPKGA